MSTIVTDSGGTMTDRVRLDEKIYMYEVVTPNYPLRVERCGFTMSNLEDASFWGLDIDKLEDVAGQHPDCLTLGNCKDVRFHGCRFVGGRDECVGLTDCEDLLFEDCEIGPGLNRDHDFAVLVNRCRNVVFRNCVITGQGRVPLVSDSTVTLDGCTCRYGWECIELAGTSRINVLGGTRFENIDVWKNGAWNGTRENRTPIRIKKTSSGGVPPEGGVYLECTWLKDRDSLVTDLSGVFPDVSLLWAEETLNFEL